MHDADAPVFAELHIDASRGEMRARGRSFKEGAIVTVDGSSGEVLAGVMKMIEPELTGDFGKCLVLSGTTPLDKEWNRHTDKGYADLKQWVDCKIGRAHV